MKNVVIYAKTNQGPFAEERINEQINRCMKYACEHDLTVIAGYTDIVDSKRRMALDQLIKDASCEWDCILMVSISRLSRDARRTMKIYKKLNAKGIEIVTVDGSFNDATVQLLCALDDYKRTLMKRNRRN